MLRQASVQEVDENEIPRENTHIAVVMRFYPRFLKKEKRDEYVRALAPDEKLFNDFRAMREKLADHNAAFRLVKYEERFRIDQEGEAELKRLSDLSRELDVYLVCQCSAGERCHRELLLLMARHKYGASIESPRFRYPAFEKRLISSAL